MGNKKLPKAPRGLEQASIFWPSEIKNFWRILALFLAISAGTKLVNLSEPKDFYFDEVYHAFTATYYLNDNPASYGLYHKAPPGKAVEWTHPPLAKLLMAGSMAIFGENSFGWRFSSVLFGTGAIFFAALLTIELGFSHVSALIVVFLLSIEGLVFTQSRIGMNDAHFLCFAYMSFWLYVRWRNDVQRIWLLPVLGVSLGLAAATKWSALFVFAVVGIDLLLSFFLNRRFRSPLLVLIGLLSLTVIPFAVYCASYLHAIHLGHDWNYVVELQRQMWGYHTGLKATHPYQSVPYQWIFNLRPVWMWVDYSQSSQGKVANIYNLGNSVIMYTGLISILLLVRDLFKKFDWSIWFVVLTYFMVWVPWSFSPRIMLFYHYTPAIPMLCIAITIMLHRLIVRRYVKTAISILSLALIWFVVFYPNNAGIHVDKAIQAKIYNALESWK